MIIMAVSVFFSQDKVTKQGAVILRKSTLYDSRVFYREKRVWGGGVFKRVESAPLSATRNKHTASVEGYREIIKSDAIPAAASLGFIANVKLPDYI